MSLTQVYCSAEQPTVDIVFVHEPFDPWTSSGSFWPSNPSDIMTPVRILTYKYSASLDTFTETLQTQAEHLASILAENRKITDCPGRPLIFVGHSLGGLLVKTLLLHCLTIRDEQSIYADDIYQSTYGIVLLGAHNPTGSTGWGSIVHNISNAVLGKKGTHQAGSSIQKLGLSDSFEMMEDFKITLEETLPTHGSLTVLEKPTPFTHTKHNGASVPTGLSKFNKNEPERTAIVHLLGELSSRARIDDLQKTPDTLTTLSRTPNEPLFVVPTDLHPNATFYGKRDDFDRLHTTLTSPSDGIHPRAVLICGPPGAGKTYLARQYIWTHRASYPGGIFWVNSASFQSLTSGVDKIALALANTRSDPAIPNGAKPSVQTVHDHLCARTGWLLVFDGLDPPDNDRAITYLAGALPANREGSILYTSVDDSLASKPQLHRPERLRVSPLPVEEACRLLFTKLGIQKPLEMQVRKATLIAMRYEGLPLAIHAVCNYLSRTAKPIERFRVDTRLADAMLTGPFFRALDRLYSESQFGVLNLVNILCFFDAPMRVDFLRVGARAVEKYDMRLCDGSEDLDASCRTMMRYGLVQDASDVPESSSSDSESQHPGKSEGKLSAIKMHGVVRFVCRDRLRTAQYDARDEGQYHAWLLAAFEVLSASYEGMRAASSAPDDAGPESDNAKHTADNSDYLLHVQSLAKLFPRKGSVSTAISEAFERLKRMNKSILDDLSRLGAAPGAASSRAFDDIESDQSLPTPSRSQNESQSQASDDLPSDGEWGIVNAGRLGEEQHPSRWNEIRHWARQTAVRTMETPLLTRFVPKNRLHESPYRHSDAVHGYLIRDRTRSDDSPFRAEGSMVRPSIRSMTHPSVFLPGELPSGGYRRTERQSPGAAYSDGIGFKDLAALSLSPGTVAKNVQQPASTGDSS